MSAREVSRRLGICVDGDAVRTWIEKGWLKGERGQKWGPNPRWYVVEEDLLAFLENPLHWHVWEPSRIPDMALREWCEEQRSGVRWLSTREVGERFCVGSAAVHQWIRDGELPAVRYGNFRVRESDLVGFVPPCEQPRVGRWGNWNDPEEEARLLAMLRSGASFLDVARRLGRSEHSIVARWRKLNAQTPVLEATA